MEPVSDNNTLTPFPFEALDKKPQVPLSDADTTSEYTAQAYDNRSRISELAAGLDARLDSFNKTLAFSFFFSESFSWLTMTAESSDTDVAVPEAYADAEESVWLLKTDALARARAHTTVYLASDDRTDFDTGTYEFNLTMDDEVYGIELGLENDDTAPLTNHDMLVRLERAFNSSGAQVQASVGQTYEKVYSSHYADYGLEKASYLELASSSTGEDESFFVEDTSGEIIAALGLDQTVAFGQNSTYTVDGEPFEFYSNTVEVDGEAVQAYLTGISGESPNGEPTQIETRYGFTAAAESVVTVISAYNDLIDWIDDNEFFISNTLKTSLFSEFNSAVLETQTVSHERTTTKSFAVVEGNVKIYDDSGISPQVNTEPHATVESGLADIGITLNADGTLDVGADFETGFKSRFLEIHDTLAGDNGFFTKIGNAIDTIRSEGENRYTYSKNHVLVYASDADADARKVYQENVSTLINTFA